MFRFYWNYVKPQAVIEIFAKTCFALLFVFGISENYSKKFIFEDYLDEEKQSELLNTIKTRYDEQTKPEYAASRLWVDAIIDPEKTREWVSMGIEVASESPAEKPFRPGVLQT